MPNAPEAFRLGVNYWPSETAMNWLARYDASALRRDFAQIRAVGMDTVRIFLRWEDIQPDMTRVNQGVLAHVVDTANAAHDNDVELIVTFFTGHMSGVNWAPPWATGGDSGDERFRVVSGGVVQRGRRALRNWYGDPDIVDAQVRLADAVSAALAGHPAVWAWDLGNENSNCTIPPDRATADQWLERMTAALRHRDPSTAITVGTHMEDIEADRLIGPAEAARWCDFVCMHGYPIYAAWASGPTDAHLLPFLTHITRWLAGGAPVLFEEFGLPTAPRHVDPVGVQVSETDCATYVAASLDGLREAGSIGALLWCYTDYEASLYQTPPLDEATHERSFGLWRADNSAKPAIAEVSARAARPCIAAPSTPSWLDITWEEFVADRPEQLRRLYARYCASVASER
jgi:endo-1,4-beta-mannosidase